MNVVNFNERSCEKYRRYFDAYLDNELLVETNQDVLQHVTSCPDCNRILENRARMKQLIREAVKSERAPLELTAALRSRLRTERRSFFAFDTARWSMAAAAVLMFAIVGAGVLRWGRIAPFANTGGALHVVSANVQKILAVGLVDHVHCAILFQQWKRFITFDEMKEKTGRSALGPEFIDLVPLVQAKLDPKYKIVNGHRCSAGGRRYIHLMMTADENKTIVSLVITEKQNEAFALEDAKAVVKVAGIPIYSDSQGILQMAGFESDKYLAYIVSNLDHDSNMKIASALAPVVYTHLHELEL